MNTKFIPYKIAAILLFAALISSCSEESTREEIKLRIDYCLGFSIPNSFKVIENEKAYGVGEYGISYLIRFEKTDFLLVERKVDFSSWNEEVFSESKRFWKDFLGKDGENVRLYITPDNKSIFYLQHTD